MKKVLVCGDSFMTQGLGFEPKNSAHVPKLSDPECYYTYNSLIKLGFDKKNIRNISKGGISMTDILMGFVREIEMDIEDKFTHVLIGCTSLLRVSHFKSLMENRKERSGKERTKDFQTKNFNAILQSQSVIPAAIYRICETYNIQPFFIKNLFITDENILRQKDHWGRPTNMAGVDIYEFPPKASDSFRNNPIPYVPMESQWSDYTPLHYTDFHEADEKISTNHLDELGNNICSSILYERLKQIGWNGK